jgi:hypothetical protein
VNSYRAVIATFVLIGFVTFSVFLVLNANTKEGTEWERWIYVFGAAEAIAFAGLGWVFGREINRERAVSAEAQAEAAQEEAKTEQAKGRTLAGMVIGGQRAMEAGGAPAAAVAGGGGVERMGAAEAAPEASASALAALGAAADYANSVYDLG